MTVSEVDSIALLPEQVELSSGKWLNVPGISATGLIYIGRKYPDIVANLFGGQNDKGEIAVDNLWWTKLTRDQINSFIAAGCGKEDDENAEQEFSALAAFDQFTLMEVIIRRTMPRGLGPFVDTLSKMLMALNPTPPKEPQKIRIRQSAKPSLLSPNGGAETSPQSGASHQGKSLPISQ